MFAKNLIYKMYQKYILYNRTQAFIKRYSNVDRNLFELRVDSSVIKQYKKRWNAYGEKVEINTFLLCCNLSGKCDFDIVPENFFAALIEPKLNPFKELSIFDVKNVYERWFYGSSVFPESYFHKIDGVFYDADFSIIPQFSEWIESFSLNFPLIMKPSLDTYGGAGVTVVNNKNELVRFISSHKHAVCQELILQNDYLTQVNPGINSIRTCLYRTQNGLFEVINNSI